MYHKLAILFANAKPWDRSSIAAILRKEHQSELFDTLVSLTKHPNRRVKSTSAVALSLLRDERAVPILINLTQSESTEVAAFAAAELADKYFVGKHGVFEALMKLASHDNGIIRISAVGGLCRYNNEQSYRLLVQLLGDDDEDVASEVLYCLVRIGLTVFPRLQYALHHHPVAEGRKLAAEALLQIDTEAAKELIKSALPSEVDKEVKEYWLRLLDMEW